MTKRVPRARCRCAIAFSDFVKEASVLEDDLANIDKLKDSLKKATNYTEEQLIHAAILSATDSQQARHSLRTWMKNIEEYCDVKPDDSHGYRAIDDIEERRYRSASDHIGKLIETVDDEIVYCASELRVRYPTEKELYKKPKS